jgi:hypothetical protein
MTDPPVNFRESFREGVHRAEIRNTKDAIFRALQVSVPAVVAWNLPIAWYWRIASFFVLLLAVGVIVNLLRARRDGFAHSYSAEGVDDPNVITSDAFERVYLRRPGAESAPEIEEVVDLLVRAGIGVGIYSGRNPPIFWRKAAVAANELRIWLQRHPAATPEARGAQARKVIDSNRLVHRSLRSGG